MSPAKPTGARGRDDLSSQFVPTTAGPARDSARTSARFAARIGAALSARTVAWTIFGLTVVQLAVATFASTLEQVELPQFEGKAFGARLVVYPLMMLLPPTIWWTARRLRRRERITEDSTTEERDTARSMPWDAFAWIMLPFLVDVTGNTLDLYDSVAWWDDLNHLVNWFFLSLGAGLLLARAPVTPRWALGLTITGLGAVLAICWELGEWYAFIRHGTELDTAYPDTLGDEALGTLGALLAALVITLRPHDHDRGEVLTPARGAGTSPSS
jgi:hypothetical protein